MSKPPPAYDSVAEAVHGSGAHNLTFADVPLAPNGGAMGSNSMAFSIKRSQSLSKSPEAAHVIPMTVRQLGNSKTMLVPRLLILWVCIMPFCLIRCMWFAIKIGIFAGGIWSGLMVLAVPGSMVTNYHVYRPVLQWAQDDYVFQTLWDWMCFFISLFVNIFVFVVRLQVDIWNGFCPFLNVFIELMYTMVRMLVVIVANMPILQYMVFWFLRLLLFTAEVFFDCVMQILSAFGSFVKEMTVGLTEVMIAQAQEDLGSRRLGPSPNIYVPVGEVLLIVCVVMITMLCRMGTAILVALMQIIPSFLQTILPMIFWYMKPVMEIILKIFSILTSDPVKRFFLYLISAMPIILKYFEAFACGIVPYLGAAGCGVLYILAISFSFLLKYLLRPMTCAAFAFLAGCFRSYIYAAMAGDKCYSCGNYNTACGCSKYFRPSTEGDCSSTCTNPYTEVVIDVPPPASPPTGNRTYDGVDTAGNRVNAFITDPNSLDDQYEERDAGPDDTSDIQTDTVGADITKTGGSWETCDINSDPTCQDGGAVATTDYTLSSPNVRRRRTHVTAAERPAVEGPTSAPTSSPTVAPTASESRRRSTTTVTTDPGVDTLVSAQGVYTASPGFYESAVVQFEGDYVVFRIGSLAYQSSTGITCLGGVDCNLDNLASALSTEIGVTPFVLNSSSTGTWKTSEWLAESWMQVDLNTPAKTTSVEVVWAQINGLLFAPSAYDVIVTYADTTSTTVGFTASCLGTGASRTDSVSISTLPQNATSVRVRFDVANRCSTPTYHTAPFQINSLRVWGKSQTVNFTDSDLRTTASLRARVSMKPGNSTMWDPCASGLPQRVSDGQYHYPSVFWSTDTSAIGLDLELYNETGSMSPYISTVTVHLAATNHLPANDVMMCTSNVTSWAAAQSSQYCVYAYEPFSYDTLWDADLASVYKQDLNYTGLETLSNVIRPVFFNSDYQEKQPWPVRGGHLQFNVDDYVNSGVMTLWMGPNATNSLRGMTWDVAQLETQMHQSYYVGAQWMSQVSAALLPDGKTVDTEQFHSLYCEEETNAAIVGMPSIQPSNAATYLNPFGSTSTTRKWVGITEVTFRGRTAVAAPSRRASSDYFDESMDSMPAPKVQPGHGSMEAKIEDLRRHSREAELKEKTKPDDHLYGVNKVMMERGLGSFRHGLSDSARGHLIRDMQSRSAPKSHQEHPFHSDLRQMPDPAEEALFVCTRTIVAGVSRLKCHVSGTPLLDGPSPSVNYTSNVSGIFKDYPVVHAKMQQTHELIEQRSYARKLSLAERESSYLSAAARRLQGSSFDPWNAVKDRVEDLISSALSLLEKGITAAMQCSSYCTEAYHCSNSGSLAQCIPAMVQFVAGRMFQCDSDQSIYDCTIGRLIRWVMTMLEFLMDYAFRLIDLVGEGIGLILGLGDLLKVISCWGCSITSIITGVLADFISNFPLSQCMQIVDIGTSQCGKWGVGTIEEVGAVIFGEFMPLMKALFGALQVAPAIAYSVLDLVILVFAKLLEVFPHFIGDGYTMLMWFQSSAGTVGTMQTLFEAMGPILQEAKESSQGLAGMEAYGSITDDAVWEASDTPSGLDVVSVDDTLAAGTCYESTSGSTSNPCNGSAWNTTTASYNALTGEVLAGESSYAAVRAGSGEMDYDLGGCGCVTIRPACYDGAGTGNCPFKDSTSSTVRAAAQAQVAEQAANGDASNSSSWPVCADVPERLMSPDYESTYGAASSELQRVEIASKKCVIYSRATTVTGLHHNDMALQDVRSKNLNPGSTPSWWPYKTFSRQDGEITSITDYDYMHSQFPERALHYPSLEQTFRRRSDSGTNVGTGSRRILRHRAIMGVSDLFSDYSDSENEKAREQVREMMRNFNKTYAQLQVEGIQNTLAEAGTVLRELVDGTMMPDTKDAKKMGAFVMANTRRLLGLELSQSDFADLACGFSNDPNHPPTMYPCTKHLWCGVPPPFPRDWQFLKEWISWKESWVSNTKCPEMDTYAKAYLFMFRAICKSVRTLVDEGINVWPWNSMVSSFWSFASFPDDEWPQRKLHPSPQAAVFEVLCISLNIGPYVVMVVLILLLVSTSSVWYDMGLATMIVFEDVFESTVTQDLEIDRHRRERDFAIAVQQQPAKWKDSGLMED